MKIIKDNGFTLLELMTVIAILSILATGTGFVIASNMPNYHLKQAASALFCDFQLAKSTAVLHQETVQMVFDPAGNTYRIEALGSDGAPGGAGTAQDSLIKQVTLAGFGRGIVYGSGIAPKKTDSDFNITYPPFMGTLHRTTFHINGRVGSLGYVYLTHASGDLCFRVGTPTMAGVVRISKASQGIWDDK